MPHKPVEDEAPSARVSPTATKGQSSSANVWRLLESKDDFREGMERAADDFENGRVVPAREFLKRPR